MGKYRKPRKSQWRVGPLLLIPVFAAVMVISAIQLLRPEMEEQTFRELAAVVSSGQSGEAEPTHPEETGSSEEISGADNQTEPNENMTPENSQTVPPAQIQPLPQYAPLYEMNSDFFGWIHMDGTKVDYPVMYCPQEPEKYLKKNFFGENSASGVPFLAGDCQEDCGNYIVYGHNMKNGTMFNGLLSYESREFWEEHPTVRFDTLFRSDEYKVFAAFYSRVFFLEEEDVFRFYDYTDLRDEGVFYEFAEQAKRASLYDTGVEAEYGDSFLTLITCAYHVRHGRFVVIAVKNQEQ